MSGSPLTGDIWEITTEAGYLQVPVFRPGGGWLITGRRLRRANQAARSLRYDYSPTSNTSDALTPAVTAPPAYWPCGLKPATRSKRS